MSGTTLGCNSIDLTPPANPWRDPDEIDLLFMGMDKGRYNEEMAVAFQVLDDVVGLRMEQLDELPETPELKTLRAKYQELRYAPISAPQDPMLISLKASALLGMIWDYYHTPAKKASKAVIASRDAEDLVELPAPEGVTQLRAMVILRALKARPKQALHTEDCRKLLEGAEGRVMDRKMVSRAMVALAELYAPRIVAEIFDGSYRVRIDS